MVHLVDIVLEIDRTVILLNTSKKAETLNTLPRKSMHGTKYKSENALI